MKKLVYLLNAIIAILLIVIAIQSATIGSYQKDMDAIDEKIQNYMMGYDLYVFNAMKKYYYMEDEIDLMFEELDIENDSIEIERYYWGSRYAHFTVTFYKEGYKEDYIVVEVTTNEEEQSYKNTSFVYDDNQLIDLIEYEEFDVADEGFTLIETLYNDFIVNGYDYESIYEEIYEN
jgi:hypothetical protein